jgi:hypothetical protein
MEEERRKDDRVKIDLKVCWEGALTQLEGAIVDLSTSGCFILSDDRVRIGELIRVVIYPPGCAALYIWGEVVYQIPEMGFAVRFTSADESDVEILRRIVKAELRGSKWNERGGNDVPEYNAEDLM